MKRSILILALILVLMLTACGAESDASQLEIVRSTTEATQPTEAATEGAQEAAGFTGPFAFEVEGVTLIPGQQFQADKLPAAESVYEVPSCAIEGTDNVYNYGTHEITAFKDAAGEMIYSIYILDANIATPEGLALGDRLDKVVELYGEGYEVNGSEYRYTSQGTVLSVIVQNDLVISIEIRLDV